MRRDLNATSCCEGQANFIQDLSTLGVDAALLNDAGHRVRLFDHHERSITGAAHIDRSASADSAAGCRSSHLGTLDDDLHMPAQEPVLPTRQASPVRLSLRSPASGLRIRLPAALSMERSVLCKGNVRS